MSHAQVLIVGAGPTGLVLALWLARLGVRVRLIDKTAEPGTTSRALGVQARTLEFYHQLGLSREVVDQGLEFAVANLWARGKKAARVDFGHFGQGISPFPYMLIFPQDEHERFLIAHLSNEGVAVERQTELLGIEDDGARVLARLRGPDGTEEVCEAEYLAGCDGARSSVREALGTGFPGGTYAHLFYVADAEGRGPVVNGELHVALDDNDFLAAFPMKGLGHARLIGTVEISGDQHEALSWGDVSKTVLERLSVDVERVNWFSTYHVHHRVAVSFRQGRAFLLGDAAHIHSPVGGQGMNTGMGDAVNLAWKLAAVLQERASVSLLDTYEPERIAFARRLVATTDRVFTAVTSPGRLARLIRVEVAPRVLPLLARSVWFRRFMFRTISQTAVHYRSSSLSEGQAGQLRGGDRLPWIGSASDPSADRTDNFAPLTALDWQVHVYGKPAPELDGVCKGRGLPCHTFPWRPRMDEAGVKRGAVYLVRPDGYIGLADAEASPIKLERYLDSRGIRPRAAPAEGRSSFAVIGSGPQQGPH
jgi:2-polyprenyl-6-methoxyphenol hydroxylase-like FAD-dependent oxidoreductase